jgi:hypothetical protein
MLSSMKKHRARKGKPFDDENIKTFLPPPDMG